jgi:hypothetical protein
MVFGIGRNMRKRNARELDLQVESSSSRSKA